MHPGPALHRRANRGGRHVKRDSFNNDGKRRRACVECLSRPAWPQHVSDVGQGEQSHSCERNKRQDERSRAAFAPRCAIARLSWEVKAAHSDGTESRPSICHACRGEPARSAALTLPGGCCGDQREVLRVCRGVHGAGDNPVGRTVRSLVLATIISACWSVTSGTVLLMILAASGFTTVQPTAASSR